MTADGKLPAGPVRDVLAALKSLDDDPVLDTYWSTDMVARRMNHPEVAYVRTFLGDAARLGYARSRSAGITRRWRITDAGKAAL